MLFGQHRGRHQDGNLAAILDHLEGGPDRHLGLAVADIAADQPVHRLGAGQIVDGVVDGLVLARGLVKGKRFFEFLVELARRRKGTALPNFTLGIDVEQFLGHFPDLVGDLFFGDFSRTGVPSLSILGCLSERPS